MTKQVQKQVPSVGRIVHIFDELPGGHIIPQAAIITWVDPGAGPESDIDLAILGVKGLAFAEAVPYGPGKVDHWDWPAFVPPVTVDVEE